MAHVHKRRSQRTAAPAVPAGGETCRPRTALQRAGAPRAAPQTGRRPGSRRAGAMHDARGPPSASGVGATASTPVAVSVVTRWFRRALWPALPRPVTKPHLPWKRGRKQDHLLVWADVLDDLHHLRLKTHVKHPVGLVQHQVRHLGGGGPRSPPSAKVLRSAGPGSGARRHQVHGASSLPAVSW